jgi:TRAP-type C4-dicarboxylate transport system permease small subunit
MKAGQCPANKQSENRYDYPSIESFAMSQGVTPPKSQVKLFNVISAVSVWVGKVGGYSAIILIIGLMFFEVIMRRVFHRPTTFTLETVLILQAMFVATSAAFILRSEGHVSVTFVTDRLSENLRHWFLCVTSLVSVAFCALICIELWNSAVWNLRTHLATDVMLFPIAPFQFALIAGFVLLGLQFIVRSYEQYKMTDRGSRGKDVS